MSLEVSGLSNNSQFKKLDSGVYDAVCDAIAAVGAVYTPAFNKWSNKVYIHFTTESGDGIWMNETQSIGTKSRLGKKLRSWRGRDFTPEELAKFSLINILGVSCQLVIEKRVLASGNEFSNVESILPAKKKLEAKDKWVFDVDDPAKENYDKLPQFIKNAMETSKQAINNQHAESAQSNQNARSGKQGVADQGLDLGDIPF